MARTELTGKQIKDKTVSLADDVTGVLPVANGGTGSDTLPLNNVLLGNGTGALQAVAPGSTGSVLSSNGSAWSAATLDKTSVGLGNVSNVAAATTATASTVAQRDANANLSADAFIPGFTTTVTAAGTTTLTVDSTQVQEFTGTTTQTVKLPTTSIAAGAEYTIINNSTGSVTVQSSDATPIVVISNGGQVVLTALTAAPTTPAGWKYSYFGQFVPSQVSSGSTLALRDSNANLLADNHIPGFTTQAAAAATTSLTVDSRAIQEFTGSTSGQTVQMPTTNVPAGFQMTIINSSAANIAVQSSGANLITNVQPSTFVVLTALVAAPTAAGHWVYTRPFTSGNSPNALVMRDSSGGFSAAGIQCATLTSTQATGTAPFTVASTTQVTNLNASYVVGLSPSYTASGSSIAARDANAQIFAKRFVGSKDSIATAAATTNLGINHANTVEFTGTTTQTVLLPTTGVPMGMTQTIVNNSTGILTIQTSSGSFMAYMNPGDILVFYALQDTPTTNAHWRTLAPAGIQPVFTITGNQTVSQFHGGTLCVMDNSAAATITIPTNASIAFPIGTSIDFVQKNTGSVTFAAANSGTTTINGYPGLKIAGQYCGASLRKIGTDAWIAVGALSA